jgi:hypothetical protein
MPKRTRLTDKHPTSQKLEKVFALLHELNLSVEIRRYGTIHIKDGDSPEYEMMDADNGQPVFDFPPNFEYKLVYDNYDEDHTQELLES